MPAEITESAAPLAEIAQGPGAFELFLDKNQKGIVILAIVLALVAVAIVVYRGIETSHQETAGAALNKATDLAGYQALIDSNPDTRAAASAMVLLADSQWTAGRQDDAIGTLRKVIEKYPDHPAIPTAKASLGAKLMAQGKAGDATKVFEDLATDPDAKFLAPFALISLGDMARAAGDLDKASESYEKVKNFPDSNFAETANRRLATLKSKPPVEIDAPPAPPAPPAGEQTPPFPMPPGGLESPGIELPAGSELSIPEPTPSPEPAPAPGSEPPAAPAPAPDLPK